MYYIWLAFSNFKYLFLTISVLYFKHNKRVAKRGYTKVFCRMNEPLKMLSCRFRYFKFSSINIAFVKQFMIKPPFQNRKFSCLTFLIWQPLTVNLRLVEHFRNSPERSFSLLTSNTVCCWPLNNCKLVLHKAVTYKKFHYKRTTKKCQTDPDPKLTKWDPRPPKWEIEPAKTRICVFW